MRLYRSQRDKFKKHGFELKFLFSIFSKRNQIKIIKAGVKLQAYVTLEILCNPWTKVRFDETYMEMSKYENSLFPYSLQITVNLPEWKLKVTNFTLISFLRLFTKTITPERKSFFSKLRDKYCQNWLNPWGIVT